MVSPQKLIEKEEILMKVIVFRYNSIKRIKNMKHEIKCFPNQIKTTHNDDNMATYTDRNSYYQFIKS